ncbi:MAG: enoyl-CoA hydratase [Acidiphilium sp. 37-64-53]|uniref:bifunctional enoyl-CoA hydratase/phosphate acetyltransferase n=1 Tax=Acidiphilium TaxID=522 RepID=UPI000BCDE4E7|nr:MULTISPECIES: bifunctional enoyl-CoA hydratase/phosphate acetyltransferase [Acidiphilium]OYW01115.1 MAG: enoyl-CoA hydratase [Acidiphilium sp. 37-64-53]OZB28167.1 MAG: enoyl-CoA hydratase [Acidiphilium sp. 34-64-41]HQT85434.1 bifunctional enoyl-CoA hydratase/phosphate acetyltransferase [Acidiphilium rubrum]
MQKFQRAPLSTSLIENRVFDDIAIGDTASISRTLTLDDIALFAYISGDINPAHMDAEYARTDMFHHIIVHGMWTAGLISAVLGTRLPGPGTIYLDQSLQFRAPVAPGDTITASVTVTERMAEKHRLTLDCSAVNQNNVVVLRGTALVQAPTEAISRPAMALPDVRLTRHERFNTLLGLARARGPCTTAIAHPCDEVTLRAALDAAAAGLIVPILVGPAGRIRAAAGTAGLDLTGLRIEDAPHSHAAAARAVQLVHDGAARLLMKGALHTDELMHAVMHAETGLRTDHVLSHIYVMDVPGYPRPLLLTDAAINIAPNLTTKAGIAQNAIDLARALGIDTPKLAVLAAVETINPAMPSTLDAAALCKMAERGQITGGLIDGPLAFDNAVSRSAAAEKNIISAVAGQADILLAPDLEAGNMMAKQLTFLAGADAAGVVAGARVPIILTSRADDSRTRLASCAVALLMVAHDHG